MRHQPENPMELFLRSLEVFNDQSDVLESKNVQGVTDALAHRVIRIDPATIVSVYQFYGEAGQVLRIYKRFVAVVRVEDFIVVDRHADLAETGDVALDIVGFDGDVFESLPAAIEELVYPGLWIPILNEVQPAFVSQEDSSIELHPLTLIVPKIAGFQAKHAFKSFAGVVEVADHHTDVLNSEE